MEKNESDIFKELLRPGDIFFDIGANVGVYTLLAASKVGSTGKVYSFEPVGANYNRLRHNISLNEFTNVITNKIAVSDVHEILKLFTSDKTNTGSASIAEMNTWDGGFEEVETTTIDDYVRKIKLSDDIRLIKIDVEGSELKVLDGMRQVLSRENAPHLLIEINSERLESVGATSRDIFVNLSKLNYEALLITKSGLRPIDYIQDAQLLLFRKKLDSA